MTGAAWRERAGAAITRAGALTLILAIVGMLPWLAGRDPALSILRARSAEQEPTKEALDAVRRQQGCVLALILVGLLAGMLTGAVRRQMLGVALRDAALSLPARPTRPPGRQQHLVLAASGLVMAAVIGWGLLREPLRLDTAGKLAAPSWAHPFGTDALGRDVLARLGHGALATLGVAILVCVCSYVVAMLISFLPGPARGAAETANAVPPMIAGILVASIMGPGTIGASVAVGLVSWPALAAHAAALVQEARASTHIEAERALGAPPSWILFRHILPAVAGPVARHAAVGLPGIALALASLGFLSLGAQPPAPEWGLMLAESLPYVERAPWAALVPAGMLLLVAVFAVTLPVSGAPSRRRAGNREHREQD